MHKTFIPLPNFKISFAHFQSADSQSPEFFNDEITENAQQPHL